MLKWINNMKVRRKMIDGFAVVIVLMVALAVVSMVQLNRVSELKSYAINFAGEKQATMLEVQVNMRDLRRVASTMAMYAPLGDASNIDPLINEAADFYSTVMGLLDKYNDLVNTDTRLDSAGKNSLLATSDELREIVARYKNEVADPVGIAARAGQYDEAMRIIIDGAPIAGEMRPFVDAMTSGATARADAASQEADVAAGQAVTTLISISVAAAVVAVVVAIFIARSISKPLESLTTYMKKAAATGDFAFNQQELDFIKKYGQYKNEISQCIRAVAELMEEINNEMDELEHVANGDLTIKHNMLSDNDKIGISLTRLVDNFNNTLNEINTATEQVSTSSMQIAGGAQSLAQGSTQQAASIQQLSSSIHAIAERTKANAETASQTAKLSVTIKDNAENGSRHMDEMIAAVAEINEASKNISKIISTIDDIAFQTNILALNAAVEAARAGQHGKGFAVVAEEVRNLASKSAEAAKDTGDMIQTTIDKAELGTRIAGETAASLEEIVSGINEASQFIEEIAKISEEQSLSIEQINIGIDQVSEVVHQNSATAQESAAASEQMRGQSSMLQQLIAQFRLKNNDPAYGYLPSADEVA